MNRRRFPSPDPERRMLWWRILWKYSIFEAGDSAWSLIIVSTYFGAFLQVVLKEPGANLGWAVTTGALIIAVIFPILALPPTIAGGASPICDSLSSASFFLRPDWLGQPQCR